MSHGCDCKDALLAAGKLAVASHEVLKANGLSLGRAMERLEYALEAYDREILTLHESEMRYE
jgi:hypothetical protein